ncbi:hypothetical protein [Rhizobium leguminosarum]|uniref:hypothetical protein n=1 Tax=Rhizobium leguminosarum TaxID=384 RepID=UPI001FEE54E2|nr:hypothetical protein [Rhizobium leguminosarum]
MFDEIQALKALDGDAARTRLGAMLNLSGPAPSDVLQRAIEDRIYARYLIMLREAPNLQKRLVDSVRSGGWQPKSVSTPEPEVQSSIQLAAKAAKALGKWGASGFRKLDSAEFEARWAICQACPNLMPAPQRIVYQGLKILSSEDQRVCGKCGCTAKAKAHLSTETCPDIHPDDPTRTRWGQPLPTY